MATGCESPGLMSGGLGDWRRERAGGGDFRPRPDADRSGFKGGNGILRDEGLNKAVFESLAETRRKLALWRVDGNKVRPNSSLGSQTPAIARRAMEQSGGLRARRAGPT